MILATYRPGLVTRSGVEYGDDIPYKPAVVRPFELCPESEDAMALIDAKSIITLKGEEPGDKDYKIYCDKLGDAESLFQGTNPLRSRMNADAGL